VYFHGSGKPVTAIDERNGADGELLCLSGSVNIARRYGEIISRFTLSEDAVVYECTLLDWMSGRAPTCSQLAAEGYAAAVVAAETSSFDFGAPTIFVLRADVFQYGGVASAEEIASLDDGLAFSHEPKSPGDRGWAVFVDTVYGGDESAATADLSP